MPEDKGPPVKLLECTLRDGSYAVDFKFTESDTALLTKLLFQVGFRWIEVGHGFGLCASSSGKGTMPASDETLIRAAKASAPEALIGSFCIQGIASLESLRSAREAGLDFVRIGANASEAEKAFPYLEHARKAGLIPFLNFMKTHTVSPRQFAQDAEQALSAGAEVIVVVDSSGGMLPEEVAAYFEALRSRCGCKMGFHAHNNLQLAAANAIQAYRCGAEFIDVTLYGLGRSAGNLPAEVAIALFEKKGVPTGVDLFEVMDLAEAYLEPLLSRIRMYNMSSVAMGFGRFHSSFLPKVQEAARRHQVDLRRLIVSVGRRSSGEVEDQVLEEIAASLPKFTPLDRQEVLVSFPYPGVSETRLSPSLEAVISLVEGMAITAAKRRSQPVLELVASASQAEELVLAEMVAEEEDVVLGRVRFGTFDLLRETLRLSHGTVRWFLWDTAGGDWAHPVPSDVLEGVGADRLIFIHSRKLLESYLCDLLTLTAHRYGRRALLLYGSPSRSVLERSGELFDRVFLCGNAPVDSAGRGSLTRLKRASDLRGSGALLDVILCLCPPDAEEGKEFGGLLSDAGILLTMGHSPRLKAVPELEGKTVAEVHSNHAYRGQVRRWISESERLRPMVEPRLEVTGR